MKWSIIVWLLLVSLFLLSFSSAGSVGISPASFKEYFEPNLEKTYSFRAYTANSNNVITLSLEGDLREFANLSKTTTSSEESFFVSLKLPPAFSKPGQHDLLVTATENVSETGAATISGIAQIQARITILVPYPGKYIESDFDINDINENEDAIYELFINNLGTEAVTVDPEIIIHEGANGNIRLEEKLERIILETKSSTKIQGILNTSRFPAGTYNVTATLYHYNITQFNETLRVGQKTLEIKDYNHQFIRGKISPFNILVQSKWNSIMDPVYAEVSITDNGRVVGRFRTISNTLEPWETKNLSGFFDASNLESKRYLANMEVHHEDLSVNKLVAIYVNEPPVSFDYRPIIISSLSILGIFLIIILVLLIKRVNQLKSRIRGTKDEKGK
jgi:hypothetical protein